MDILLQRVLQHAPTPAPIADLATWWLQYAMAVQGMTRPIERAVAAGFAADRLGYAFAAGYTEALQQLLPALGNTRAALCATESGGAHPRAMKTYVQESHAALRLSGDKTFVTLGTHAATLLVVASEGQDAQGRNRLAVYRIPADRAGVTLTPLPSTAFAPEIPHAALHLHEVVVTPEERLPGDGYERYLKPFRTVEDLHVYAALLGWLLQVARRAGWPRLIVQELLLLIAATCALGPAAPDAAATHLALGGLLASARRLREEIGPHWQLVDPTTRALWERDRPLLEVAGKARAQRLEVAWERLLSAV